MADEFDRIDTLPPVLLCQLRGVKRFLGGAEFTGHRTEFREDGTLVHHFTVDVPGQGPRRIESYISGGGDLPGGGRDVEMAQTIMFYGTPPAESFRSVALTLDGTNHHSSTHSIAGGGFVSMSGGEAVLGTPDKEDERFDDHTKPVCPQDTASLTPRRGFRAPTMSA